MSAQDLADRCEEIGHPIPRNVIANMESGRRATLPLVDVIVLAQALNTYPVCLLYPVGHADRVYEIPMLRPDREGRLALTSTHWPWTGERTRQLEGAHVALLARVENPVACKVGPRMTVVELLGLCERLDPGKEPGRLTLITRADVPNGIDRIGGKYTTLYDRRLNPRQAVSVVSAWRKQMMTNRAEGEPWRA